VLSVNGSGPYSSPGPKSSVHWTCGSRIGSTVAVAAPGLSANIIDDHAPGVPANVIVLLPDAPATGCATS
jgi:hypothetical protein